jgi:predicted metal-dependent TIM-barrel fold hydrolase
MRIIDPHLHTDRMKGKDLETLSVAGVEGAILPTPHLLPWMVSADSLFRLWDNFLDFQIKHPRSLGIDVKVTLGVPFYGMEHEAIDSCLKKMPDFLKHEAVVGLGEIGLDAGIENEEELFRIHLNIAKEHEMPIIVHTPTPHEPQASTVLDQIIQVIKEEDFPIERAVLDHTGFNTLQTRLDSGAMVGLSICYDKLNPDEAAQVIGDNPEKRERFLLNSEFGWGGEGHFSVPRAVLGMRRMGLRRKEIEQVTWENPKRFFDLDI